MKKQEIDLEEIKFGLEKGIFTDLEKERLLRLCSKARQRNRTNFNRLSIQRWLEVSEPAGIIVQEAYEDYVGFCNSERFRPVSKSFLSRDLILNHGYSVKVSWNVTKTVRIYEKI